MCPILTQSLVLQHGWDELRSIRPLRKGVKKLLPNRYCHPHPHQIRQPEWSHGHPKFLDNRIDEIGIRPQVRQETGGHGVREEDAVNCETGAVPDDYRRLFYGFGKGEEVRIPR